MRIDRANGDRMNADEEEAAPPRIGIQLARFGAKAIRLYDYDDLAEEAERDEVAESCRLAYVAATRARDHLILSGSYRPGGRSRRTDPATTPVSERLLAGLGIEEPDDGVIPVPAPRPRPGLDALPAPGGSPFESTGPIRLFRRSPASRPGQADLPARRSPDRPPRPPSPARARASRTRRSPRTGAAGTGSTPSGYSRSPRGDVGRDGDDGAGGDGGAAGASGSARRCTGCSSGAPPPAPAARAVGRAVAPRAARRQRGRGGARRGDGLGVARIRALRRAP